ncbi:hypothetical protein DE146DRAFT_646215 [Phaeosphaeria sp. MPI-PUGE-AT-0046c]|nr:hypothetical protein DE146DRAFT_646215 [Phaeosphaeria sp. MPI-PUGE-AT-0046c]
MFRARVLRRNFSLFNKAPYSRIAQSAARDGHESVVVHRVRIRRPFVSRSRIIGSIAIAASFYGLSQYISIEVKVDKATEDNQGATNDEDDDDDDEDYDDALLFLPTGFSRPRPQTFYKGSDPEWQEFKKLATDRPRCEKIHNELKSMIRKQFQNNATWKTRLGNIDVNKGKAWIEIKFPDGPPVEYERPGIELTEDLEWRKATRAVEDLHHHRLNRLFYPADISKALYQDTKQKLALSWKTFTSYVGLGGKHEAETVQNVVQRVLANPPSPSQSGVTANSEAAPGALTPTSPEGKASSESKQTAQTTSPVSSRGSEIGFVLPDPKTLTLDLTNFRQDVKKNFKPYATQPPRGTVKVLGLIQVYGERAQLTLNVAAVYDPKQNRFVGLQAALWNFRDHKQSPRGGP